MVRLEKSTTGTLSAVSDGVYLNSRYDPLGEAGKIVNEELKDSHPKSVIILGETLGYISKAVSDRFPGCRCIQIYYDSTLFNNTTFRTDDAWHPDSDLSPQAFFRKTIDDLDLGSLSLVEWAPSAKVYPAIANQALTDLRRTISMYNGNISTTALFGKRWLRNTVHNYLAIDRISTWEAKAGIVVIAAAGPTLEKSMSALEANRSSFYLIALPSSLCALLKSNLLPDLLVVTDPGYYSGVHLQPMGQKKLRIAMPYTCVRDASRFASEIILLNQGTYLENILLESSAIPHLKVDSHGTVAGTALYLSRMVGTSIVFAGLDLTGKDIQTHVRPHAFDPLLDYIGNRTSPSQTTRYIRSFKNELHSKGGGNIGAFSTYAGWFQSFSTSTDLPFYRLNPSPVRIDGMRSLDSAAFTELCQKANSSPQQRVEDDGTTFQSAPPLRLRKRILNTILEEIKNAVLRYEPPENPNLLDNRVFSGPTPLCMIYFVSTRTLLKALKSMEPGLIREAAGETGSFIDELKAYVDSWPN